jgi:hypothetical protein
MGSINGDRGKRAPFDGTTSGDRRRATEYGGTDDGSNPATSVPRPMSAAEQKREMFNAYNGSQPAPPRETSAERARRERAGGYGTRIRR